MSACNAESCPNWAGFGCVCDALGLDHDPYDRVVFIQGHRHSEPICAWPDCQTWLTREEMAALPDVGGKS